MTKREKLARASFAVVENNRRITEQEPRLWEEVDQAVRSAHFSLVDAFIAELREPDSKMLEAGRCMPSGKSRFIGVEEDGQKWRVEDIWQAMLKAIE